jgi:hypothetical protein
MPDNPDNKVGYKNPPVANRFPKGGPSPNPKGRPRGKKSFSSLVREAVDKKVVVVAENGQRRRITKREAGAAQLANGMARGELKTTQYVVGITEESERSAEASAERGSFIKGVDDARDKLRELLHTVRDRLLAAQRGRASGAGHGPGAGDESGKAVE